MKKAGEDEKWRRANVRALVRTSLPAYPDPRCQPSHALGFGMQKHGVRLLSSQPSVALHLGHQLSEKTESASRTDGALGLQAGHSHTHTPGDRNKNPLLRTLD